jgi:hypothetical protein
MATSGRLNFTSRPRASKLIRRSTYLFLYLSIHMVYAHLRSYTSECIFGDSNGLAWGAGWHCCGSRRQVRDLRLL